MLTEFPKSELAVVASYQAGEARLKLKEFEPAYQHFLRASSGDGGNEVKEQALLRLGECQALTKRWAESENTYANFVERYAKSELLRRAQLGLGWARENQKKFTEAQDAYRGVLTGGDRDETSARSQFQIGECLFGLNKYDDAIKELIKVEVNYAFPAWGSKALLEIGRVLEAKGFKADAVARYQEVLQKYRDTESGTVAAERLKQLASL